MLSEPEALLFLPSSTVRVEGGVRVATVAVQHVPTGHRYLIGWSAEDGRWVEINEWPPGEFEAFDLEYDIDDWLELLTGG